MRIERNYKRADLRRLSTESYVRQKEEKRNSLLTHWVWYRKEESGEWVAYGGKVRYFFITEAVGHSRRNSTGRRNHGWFYPMISSIASGSPWMISVILAIIQTSLPPVSFCCTVSDFASNTMLATCNRTYKRFFAREWLMIFCYS